jgi:type II secretory ATPase GspE/PulE/Tfp pilus assembly ATPase PilB-like protein/DNA-binding NarL/FixJ family response regulator
MSSRSENADLALLRLLLHAGVLTAEATRAAETALQGGHETIVDWLVRSLGITEDQLAQTIADQAHVPYVDLPTQPLNPAVIRLVAEELATEIGIVPLRALEGSLVVATVNPLNDEARSRIELETGRRVHFQVASQTAIKDALQHAYHLGDTLDSYLEGIPEENEAALVEVADNGTDIESLLNDSTHVLVDKLFNVFLRKAICCGASDVHIEPSVSELWVRYRVDDAFGDSFRLPKWLHGPLVRRCKLLAKLDTSKRPVPQNKRITLRYQGSMIELRVSSTPTQLGEKVVIQILERHIDLAGDAPVESDAAQPDSFRETLEHASGVDEFVELPERNPHTSGEDANVAVINITDEETDIEGLMRDSTLAPVVKLLNVLLRRGICSRASDILIEPIHSDVWVHYQIDGTLAESLRLPRWVQDSLIARCKLLAKLDINERRSAQSGAITLSYQDSLIELRVSSRPTPQGEKLTIRILDPHSAPSVLSELNLPESDLVTVRNAIKRPAGMILVTGPMQSGKTTTLYALLGEIISPGRNIVAIGDRVGAQLPGVNQIAVDNQRGWSFADTLRSILRQDPDVILLDEIRDLETAEIALRAAETGHLILSSVRANDAASAVSHLLGLGLEPYALGAALRVVIAQQLVRRTCASCAEPYKPDAAALHGLNLNANGHPLLRGQGCAACRKSGYAGRAPVFEVLPITRKMAALIEGKATDSMLRSRAREEGTRLFVENAVNTIHAGITTVEEVLRVFNVPSSPARQPEVAADAAVCPSASEPLDEHPAAAPQAEPSPPQSSPNVLHARVGRWPEASDAAGAGAVPETATDSPARQYRLLVVDDQPEARQFVRRTLERSGFPLTVVEASDGQQALDLAQENVPDLVVLDVMMPGMTGFDVCEHLRGNVRTAFVPILMLTALDDPGNRVRGFHAGTDDYLGKPFARAEFLARVRRLLERSYGASLQMKRTPRSAPRPEWNDAAASPQGL